MMTDIDRSCLQAAIATEAILGEMQQGVQHAFDVIRNHTVHTQGYVMIALKFIEQYGCDEDRQMLQELLRAKQEEAARAIATSGAAPQI